MFRRVLIVAVVQICGISYAILFSRRVWSTQNFIDWTALPYSNGSNLHGCICTVTNQKSKSWSVSYIGLPIKSIKSLKQTQWFQGRNKLANYDVPSIVYSFLLQARPFLVNFTYLQFATLTCRKHTIDVLISRPDELIMHVPHEDCFKEKQWVHRSIRC